MARSTRSSRGDQEHGGKAGGHSAAAAAEPPRRRFVAAQLLSIHPAGEARAAAAEQFSVKLERAILAHADIISDKGPGGARRAATTERRVVLFEADPNEVLAKAAELSQDTVVEPELPRVPARAYPAAMLPTTGLAAVTPGTGAVLRLSLQGPKGDAVPGASVIVKFTGATNAALSIVAGGISDKSGMVSVPYDPASWVPSLAAVEPVGGYWTAVTSSPQPGQVIKLQELPRTGPFGWWHYLSGATDYNPVAGRGIKVGVIDSGVGPHPYLAHAVPIGAFVDGSFQPGAEQGRDVQTHGTHVCGIIGARPPEKSPDYSGIAPGAELFVARIFSATGSGNQGDVANALDALSGQHGVDIINMSLTGAASAIEHDAVLLAQQRGTVCVCAAGNQSGSPVGHPAAYPECIAVSALGLINVAPQGTMPAMNLPTQADRFGYGGIFLAAFSNVGPSILGAAPGNGIISTIPAKGKDTPYADMSGTSMASPLAAGVLAVLLSRTPGFTAFERNANRSMFAKALFAQHALSINLNPLYQGRGMARAI